MLRLEHIDPPDEVRVLRFLGKKVGKGKQASVYEASDGYTRELVRLTDGVYGDRFVVKVIDYNRYKFDLKGGNRHTDMIHRLNIYETIRNKDLAHVIPLVHWISYHNEQNIVDKFNNKIEDVTTIPATKLLLVFPALEGVLADIYNLPTVRQRVDMCLQMIYIIQALHSIGIGHGDFHLNNIMYSISANGDYYLRAIDLDLATSLDRNVRLFDYERLCDNITGLLYGEEFATCRELMKHRPLRLCMFQMNHIHRKMDARINDFARLPGILRDTEFTEDEIYRGPID